MRALVKSRPGRGLDLVEVPDPVAGPGEVLLRVEAAGVCGSDVARYVWTRNYEAGAAKAMTEDLPRVMGHEFSGQVVAVGPDVETATVGDRVAVMNILGCGRCDACHRGMPNVCARRRTIGVHRDGGYAELCAVPEANITPIADDMGYHLAAALQPFAVATNAVTQGDLEPGDRILVWGLGPIGLGVIFAARLRGAELALGVDVNPVRLAEAEALGLPTFDASGGDVAPRLVDRLGRRSVGAVFEAAGAQEAIEWSLPVLQKRRTMVLIGNLRDRVDADLMPLIMDQQRLVGSRSNSLAVWDVAVRTIVRSGFEQTLGDEVGLDEAIERFELAAAGQGRPFTIVPGHRSG
jgi:threonine dehydrogenase-like Zn-dependent dehydrogenase